jgi:hypothetical protein
VLIYPVTADAVLPCKLLFATGFTHATGIYGASLSALLDALDTPYEPFDVALALDYVRAHR